MQLKFLRFLQEKTLERVGGNEKIEIDVRIIASAILLEDSEVIKPKTIRMRLMQPMSNVQPDYRDLAYREAKQIFEKAYFTQLLEQTGGNISQAARLAQLDRSHLRNKINSVGIKAADDSDSTE